MRFVVDSHPVDSIRQDTSEATTRLSYGNRKLQREDTPFRYGQLKSPFEYEMVRFAVTEARVILVEE